MVRAGENVASVIDAVKSKMRRSWRRRSRRAWSSKSPTTAATSFGAPWPRSKRTLVEEVIVVAFVILIFLFHFRSALVPITILPVAIAVSFLPMAPPAGLVEHHVARRIWRWRSVCSSMRRS
mgnify:CR=1 FL=1